jgi:hypothetical protein
MKPIGAVLTVALLLWFGAATRAAEPIHAPAPLPPESAFPAGASCGACNTCDAGCGHIGLFCCGGKLREWLSYRVEHRTRLCEYGCGCNERWVPLYLYFLGSCSEHPCTACGAGAARNCGCAAFGSPTGCGCFGR